MAVVGLMGETISTVNNLAVYRHSMAAKDDVSRKREKLLRCPPGHDGRDVALYNLANGLQQRFKKKREIDDLNEAITLHRESLKLRPVENVKGHRSDSLINLAFCLCRRYDELGAVDDLEEAITLEREALALCPTRHPLRGVFLHNLGVYLRTRFEKRAEVRDLEEAIQLFRAVLELHPPGHQWRCSSLRQLALCLSSRYESQGGVNDLEELVTLRRAELELYPRGHSDHVASFHNLACDLRRRYAKTAAISDLEESIELHRAALELRTPGDLDRSSTLHELTLCLSTRYEKLGMVADLEDAIEFGHETLELCPRGHPNRASSLHCLAQCLADRFRRQPTTADLDEAIVLEQEALDVLVCGDPSYDISLRCLMDSVQMKIKAQVAAMSSGALSVTHPDVGLVIRNTAFETLKTMPTRLLHTHTGILCNRDVQVSHFLSSPRYKHLVSLCKTRDQDQQMGLIRTEVPRHFQYVTLSHRWGAGEPSLRDIEGRRIYNMSAMGGLGKLQGFCAVACGWGYSWAWSDTCCIDKHSSAEVQETIGSMFTWYRQSALTIVYLSDVPDTDSIGNSEWFRRGWTLQELLAPESVVFYTKTWSPYGNLTSLNHKTDAVVLEELESVTGIERRFFKSFSPGLDDARLRLQWASQRTTTRPEDTAYSLFGIFNLHLPVMYGESAEKALGRLLAEVVSQSGDISVLDWVGPSSPFHSCFPADITSYQILQSPSSQPSAEEQFSATSEGISSIEVLRNISRSPTTVPAVQPQIRVSYALSDVYDFHSLAQVPLARFFGRLLTLPCIAYHVTSVQLKGEDPSKPSHTYNIRASGLTPLEIALPDKLDDVTRSRGALYLVRPWHSKLLGPSADLDTVTEGRVVSALWTPFNALLLTQLLHNEYKRIASSTLITVYPVDRASVLNGGIRMFNIV